MTFTYDITTIVGKIRLVIGDTTSPGVFTDEELTYFYTTEGTINMASAMAARAWAAKYTANADNEKIGDYSYAQTIVAKMLKLAETLEAKEESKPAQAWAEMDLTYGSGITEEED